MDILRLASLSPVLVYSRDIFLILHVLGREGKGSGKERTCDVSEGETEDVGGRTSSTSLRQNLHNGGFVRTIPLSSPVHVGGVSGAYSHVNQVESNL